MKHLKTKFLIASLSLSFILSSMTAFAADYRVVANDSLYKIGVLFNTPVDALTSDNQLQSAMIYPGQILKVPAKLHTVQKGDTLFLIGKQYGISLYSLRKANNKWDDMLLVGQTLILPGIKPTSETVIPYTQSEFDLLARLITAEATGEPYDSMVAVGAVVVNRVQNPDWPNSINSVINHVAGGYYQFTPVKNGYIDRPASDIAKKAAWDALYGNDPSLGAHFYFDDSSTNQWLWSKTVTARIGSMVFVN